MGLVTGPVISATQEAGTGESQAQSPSVRTTVELQDSLHGVVTTLSPKRKKKEKEKRERNLRPWPTERCLPSVGKALGLTPGILQEN